MALRLDIAGSIVSRACYGVLGLVEGTLLRVRSDRLFGLLVKLISLYYKYGNDSMNLGLLACSLKSLRPVSAMSIEVCLM